MNRKQILSTIQMLVMTQGIYGNLYAQLTSGSEHGEAMLELLERQNFQSALDLMLYLEK